MDECIRCGRTATKARVGSYDVPGHPSCQVCYSQFCSESLAEEQDFVTWARRCPIAPAQPEAQPSQPGIHDECVHRSYATKLKEVTAQRDALQPAAAVKVCSSECDANRKSVEVTRTVNESLCSQLADARGERDSWYQRCMKAEKALELALADARRKAGRK